MTKVVDEGCDTKTKVVESKSVAKHVHSYQEQPRLGMHSWTAASGTVLDWRSGGGEQFRCWVSKLQRVSSQHDGIFERLEFLFKHAG